MSVASISSPFKRQVRYCFHRNYCRFFDKFAYGCRSGPNTESIPACFRSKDDSEQVWLYIIECEKGVLYTGITNNPQRRFEQHMKGGSWLTKRLKPERLRCLRLIGDRSLALNEESYVTKLNHKNKLRYIKKHGIQTMIKK